MKGKMRYFAVHLHQFQSDALQQLSRWQRTAETFGKNRNGRSPAVHILLHTCLPSKVEQHTCTP